MPQTDRYMVTGVEGEGVVAISTWPTRAEAEEVARGMAETYDDVTISKIVATVTMEPIVTTLEDEQP